MIKVLFVIAFTSLFNTQLFAVVIVVHGSFASTTSWPQPDGDFFIELENQGKELGHSVISFCWSSIPTDNEIIKGGKMLAQLIMSYPKHEKIITIGHSHGGNVINIASQLLHRLNQRKESSFITEQAPIILEVPQMVTTPAMDFSITRSEALLLKNDKIDQEKNSPACFDALLTQAEHELAAWSQTRQAKHLHKKIAFAYTLGTPVNMTKFYPEMKAIDRMISFYSEADVVQPVLGLFERTYPMHPQRSNLRVTLYHASTSKNGVSHSDLHHHLIGRWLLCIPDVLTKLKLGNFEQFRFGIDGSVEFNRHKHPHYQIFRAPFSF